MNKKIIIYILFFFLSFGSLQTFADYLYVTENNTKVFLNPAANYKYIFWKGYKVSDSGNMSGNMKEVYLIDGKKAFINKNKLSPYISEKYLLKSDNAKLLSAKFPLFVEPNPKGDVKKVLYRGAKLQVLNKNLINNVWVRLKDDKGAVGYIWYKTLNFSNNSDNNKNIIDESLSSSSSSLFFPINNKIKETTQDPYAVDIAQKIYKLRENDYPKYMQFLENIDSLRDVDPSTYNKIKSRIKSKSSDIYIELENFGNIKRSNQDNSLNTNNQKDIQSEIDNLDSLGTEDLLNELFK